MKNKSWRLIAWDFEDGEFTIEFSNLDRYDIYTDGDHEYNWLVSQYEKLLSDDIITPTKYNDEMMEFTGKDNPFQDEKLLPDWVIKQLNP